MSKAVFCGLGIGPGDPGLITVKAIDILTNADIICVPRSNNKEESIAYEIVKQYIKNSKIIDMPYSMAPEIQNRKTFWQKHAEQICNYMDQNMCVVFVTLGDPGLYSTFAYIANLVIKMRPEYSVKIIPGVSSVNAASAVCGRSLVQAEQCLTIQPCSVVLNKPSEWWYSFDCVSVMKIGKKLPQLIARLQQLSLIDNAMLVTRAGFENQSIIYGNDLINCADDLGYLAILLFYKHLITEESY